MPTADYNFETGTGAFVRACSVAFDPVVRQFGFETGNQSFVSSCPVPPTGPIYEGDFALMLVLDETGSIGLNGAQRGVDIIDQYGDSLRAIGWVSFGDILCQQKAMTTDLAAARAELLSYADGSVYAPFFQDGGGDIPENGVDALYAGDALLRSYGVGGGVNAYIHLVTDTASFAHNVHHSAEVLYRLNDGTYKQAYIEANVDPDATAETEDDEAPLPNSVDIERLYRLAFPEGATIKHRQHGNAEGRPMTSHLSNQQGI